VRQHLVVPVALALLAAFAAGCSTPIGVREVDRRTIFRELATNAAIADEPSIASRQVLLRLGLVERMAADPAATLAALHEIMLEEADVDPATTNDRLFALAEYSFLHAYALQAHCGERVEARRRGPSLAKFGRSAAAADCTTASGYFVAASVYAYAFVFPSDVDAPPGPLDPRMRNAVDLYNLALTSAVRQRPGEINLRPIETDIHLGHLSLGLDDDDLRYADRRLGNFVPAVQVEVRGLRNRYRQPGVGAPYIANLIDDPGTTVALSSARVSPRLRVPVTVFVRYEDPLAGLRSRDIRGRIEIYNQTETHSVDVGGRSVPLEYETTAALAYSLEHSDLWRFEIAGFLHGDELPVADGLMLLEPYRRGMIPVVLVHGTASSPARWAEMLNDLRSDPRIRARYQFWIFMYATGNPILYSASLLRQSLQNTLAEVDPEGTDAALRRMVVIGHSQGGLLTKLQAIDSGDAFWSAVSDRPFDTVAMSPQASGLLRSSLFFGPQPFVARVIFISTPHRGSFLAGKWMGRFASSLFEAPTQLAGLALDVTRAGLTLPGRVITGDRSIFERFGPASDSALSDRLARLPSSVDNMDPIQPFIRTLASIPVESSIAAHSIIPISVVPYSIVHGSVIARAAAARHANFRIPRVGRQQ